MRDTIVKLPELHNPENLDNSLHWHALNYRCAATQHAEEFWQCLEGFVKRYATDAVLADRAGRSSVAKNSPADTDTGDDAK